MTAPLLKPFPASELEFAGAPFSFVVVVGVTETEPMERSPAAVDVVSAPVEVGGPPTAVCGLSW